MNLIKASNFPRAYRGIDSVFDDLVKRAWFDFAGTDTFNSHPAVNIKESEDSFELQLAAPGLNKTDFNVNVENNVLTVSTNVTSSKETSAAVAFKRREFNYNNFKRSFNLPETINAEAIGATYSNGVLLVHLPKHESAKRQSARTVVIN